MKKNDRITPDGTSDVLFSECTERRKVESLLGKSFYNAGYNEVRTPVLEFYDVYNNAGTQLIPQENMYKLTDLKGRLLVLRPDSTPPVARLVSTKLRDASLPIRIYYSQLVFRMNNNLKGQSDQIYQTGIELIGVSGKRADLEALTLAISSITSFVSEFRFEIGHAGIFKCLSEQLPVSLEQKEEIRFAIESKNYAALNRLLDSAGDSKAAEALKCLPRLFGSAAVLDEAERLIDCEEAQSAISYLRDIYNTLSGLGLEDKISVDLGLVHHNDYYTGIVFSGYAKGSGETVISGGRYDDYFGNFGRSMPACGFAVHVDSLVKSAGLGANTDVTVPQILVHAKAGFELAAVAYSSGKRSEGIMCETSVFEDEQEAAQYAKSRGISELHVVSGEVEVKINS
ncbi:MAG: ATP phosphoribosyltransferase regulatory subunit [Oscillospiraceae bacterium]|jgi:ATP phosphoribosyltransferase regulatory subunit|nr:ATP phosphoribosyltransferase regulatory subunit [Oscillospiraceae bacterium]